jgi:hypothetical protein
MFSKGYSVRNEMKNKVISSVNEAKDIKLEKKSILLLFCSKFAKDQNNK